MSGTEHEKPAAAVQEQLVQLWDLEKKRFRAMKAMRVWLEEVDDTLENAVRGTQLFDRVHSMQTNREFTTSWEAYSGRLRELIPDLDRLP